MRPMKMPGMPQLAMKRSPRGSKSGWRDSGHTFATGGPSFTPTQKDSQSPMAAPRPPAIHTGQKLMPLEPIKAPIATSAPQAGISSEMKASDSPNASANTIGGAHASCWRTKSTICWNQAPSVSSIGVPPAARAPRSLGIS